jgi:[acyl-carrier-protein] S-malonyltransferase
MQKACELKPGAMAAILALEDDIVENICKETKGVVVAANYNCPGQLVISGEVKAVNTACASLKEVGAKRALVLPVGGAFHSPLMEPAKEELANVINSTEFKEPICPVYQNVNAQPVKNPEIIKQNLISQLTAPVKWTQTLKNMLSDGAKVFTEMGPGKTLQGLVKKVDRQIETIGIQ